MFLEPTSTAKSCSMFYDLDFYPRNLEPRFSKQCSILPPSGLCFCKVRSTRSPSKQCASYSNLTSTLDLSSRLSVSMTVREYTSPTEGNVILERGSFVRLGACIIPSSVLRFLSCHSPCQSLSAGSATQFLPSTLML